MTTNYNWYSPEGQSLLRMKYDLYSEYLKENGTDFTGKEMVTEEFLNLAILEAYRKGLNESNLSRQAIVDEICNSIKDEIEIIRRNW